MLSPIQVHKILLDIQQEKLTVSLKQLASDLQVGLSELMPAIEVLCDLQVVEMEDEKRTVSLTTSGLLANLD